jgi:glycosidase
VGNEQARPAIIARTPMQWSGRPGRGLYHRQALDEINPESTFDIKVENEKKNPSVPEFLQKKID